MAIAYNKKTQILYMNEQNKSAVIKYNVTENSFVCVNSDLFVGHSADAMIINNEFNIFCGYKNKDHLIWNDSKQKYKPAHNFEKFAESAKNTEIKNLYKNEDNMKSKMIEVQSDAKLVKPNYAVALILISTMIIFVSGCITLGKDFPEANVSSITIGVTTKNEIRRLFGSPWLTGVQDGQPAWTYGSYDYSLFGERKAKDLVVQFDDQGKVSSFTFSTTDHDE